MADKYQYETVIVKFIPGGVAHVQLNRPKTLNAFNAALIRDVRAVFRDISEDSEIAVVVVSGSGRMFTAGLDLQDTPLDLSMGDKDPARAAYVTRKHIEDFQDAFTAIEKCHKPVIAAIHGACIGAGVDMTTACDIRYCSKDAYFSVKEVDIGLAADVGSLQRLPKVTGNISLVRELCLTGRNLYADEALSCGLVNKVMDTHEQLLAEAFKTAKLIATKSPVAVYGTKQLLNYSRDHSVAESLAYTATWNAAMLNTEDIVRSMEAFMTKKPAKYSKL
ncbi:putative enoyl CoA hydratase [Apophysomyces sp. BC1034]|nr:putative enoyl CoA hydratase [Apophysomyces sp. BC1015]KAG0176698.1 putative enoyl CoA hydratase [Apophysomyces sp. BC1021]KAG0187070.1 putative enoyl CoA hydratase [Apophysomyces sp. BC1034]